MRHYLQIIAAMLIWSTWGMMIRWLGLPVVVVLFYTSLIASVTVPLVLKLRGEFDLTGIGSAWPWFAGLALSSIANNITYFYALGHTTVSNAVFTHYTAPFFVALLAPLLIAERLHKVTIISLPLAFTGMALVIGASGGFRVDSGHASGIIAGTASGIAYALLIILSRKLSQMLLHQKAVFLILWITALATAPMALLANYTLTARVFVLLLVTGLFHSTVAPLLYYSALRHVLAQHAAILGYLEPLAAVPLAFLFLSENPGGTVLAGGGLIILSGYLVVQRAHGSGDPDKYK
jgi:drug/metabolite transporter (DMT)-like permease